MSTSEQLDLVIAERDLLELLCQNRLEQVEAIEAERELYMQGEARVEALNEQIDAKVSEACRALNLGVFGSTLEMIDRLTAFARGAQASSRLVSSFDDPSANPRHPECEP